MLCKLKDEPYLMRNENTKQYYGYLIDLLDRISFICNFTYEISIIKKTREDKKNDQNWNNLIDELVNKVCNFTLLYFNRNFLINFFKILESRPFNSVNYNII
jgi:hypothetical protein